MYKMPRGFVKKGSLGKTVVVSSGRKNKDKIIKTIAATLAGPAAAGGTTIYNAQINDDFNVASTIKGIRWNLALNTPSAEFVYYRWGICVFKAGEQFPTVGWDSPLVAGTKFVDTQALASTPLAYLLQPDEKVIVHGTGIIRTMQETIFEEGATKGMRKVNPGDKFIFFLAVTSNSATAGEIKIMGDIQYVLLT